MKQEIAGWLLSDKLPVKNIETDNKMQCEISGA
jgi:hypothetical protein